MTERDETLERVTKYAQLVILDPFCDDKFKDAVVELAVHEIEKLPVKKVKEEKCPVEV